MYPHQTKYKVNVFLKGKDPLLGYVVQEYVIWKERFLTLDFGNRFTHIPLEDIELIQSEIITET